ncbi:MAG: efflux RND transporter periplasmic adaptor subunit [Phycisphaerae bacterium]|nr:efflux RND transporter periplasmic adaptor subunit [Phycisphaerae bacterium]
MDPTNATPRGFASRTLSVFLRGILPIIVVTGGVLGAVHLINTAPQTTQRPVTKTSTLVQTRTVTPTSERAVIQAMGTVIAAKEIVLQPRVSGIIRTLHPALVPGGRIRAGEQIATIDAADYEVAVRQAEAALDRAKAQLLSADLELARIEGLQAHRATNKKELDDAETTKAAAAADVAAAQATLDKARLDLSRTVLTAPFSCVVVDESIDVGSLVSAQMEIATLVGTDEYWVRTSIPVDQLQWIDLTPDAGSPARVSQRLGSGAVSAWDGRVVRLLGDLEPQGRMARVLVSVPDPLGNVDPAGVHRPLLMGAYVDVTIQGRELSDVFSIGREELRDGDNIWLMNDKDELEIRAVDVVFRGRELVLIGGGLRSGERMVTSDIASPITGMPLRETGTDSNVATPATEPASSTERAGDE